MKKLIIAAAVSLFSIGAFAQDTLDGCGLGWKVTQNKTYTATATRLTTNNFVPPVFGMTSGTLGCDQLEVGQNDKEAADYVATNFEVLKSELATGEGQYVEAMAGAFGCSAMHAEIGAKVQKNYSSVVSSAKNSTELFQNIRNTINSVCI